MPTNCSLTVNGGVASLIAWLDDSCQKTEVGAKQRHAPCRRISLKQTPTTKNKMAPTSRQRGCKKSPGLNLNVVG